MRSRTFLNVSLAILALAAAYHLGARSAGAQTGMIVAATIGDDPSGADFPIAITSTGDVYGANRYGQNWAFIGNVFSGGPTPVRQESMGAVKARYR